MIRGLVGGVVATTLTLYGLTNGFRGVVVPAAYRLFG